MKPTAYLHYPRKKPSLATLSFDEEPKEHEKASGFVSLSLFGNVFIVSEEDIDSLVLFAGTPEDAVEYDVSRETIKHLARLGVVMQCDEGVYTTTMFGEHVLRTNNYF